jgi:formamidopyrimidine-DNA glycosylase
VPELPEVETTVRGIKSIESSVIEKIEVFNPNLRWPVSNELSSFLRSKKILSVYRRAKYIIIKCSNAYLIIHLGMTGKLVFAKPSDNLKKHDHIQITFTNNDQVIRYNDPRRFGSAHLVKDKLDDFKLLANLGLEPLAAEFDGNYLFIKARKRNVPIKTFIMNHHIVVGVGNIYSSEALFLSEIRPLVPACKVTRKKMEILVKNIKHVLLIAIEKGGSTISDFMNTKGEQGYFQIDHQVYNREGQPCNKCGAKIKKIIIGQRSSFFCSTCQR